MSKIKGNDKEEEESGIKREQRAKVSGCLHLRNLEYSNFNTAGTRAAHGEDFVAANLEPRGNGVLTGE